MTRIANRDREIDERAANRGVIRSIMVVGKGTANAGTIADLLARLIPDRTNCRERGEINGNSPIDDRGRTADPCIRGTGMYAKRGRSKTRSGFFGFSD
jgi:hypothetical protein